MSGYFAGLMRQTGIGAAAPSGFGAAARTAAAPAPLEREVAVDAAPSLAPAEAPPAALDENVAPPPAPPAPHPLDTPGLIPRAVSFSAPAAAPVAPLEVDAARAATPPPPLAASPSGTVGRILAPAADASGIPSISSDPPSSDRVPPVERTVLRETESAPSAAPVHPVRGIPADPPRTETSRIEVSGTTPASHGIAPSGTRPVPATLPLEAAFEVPAPPPPAVHPFAQVLAEARRWVAATPVPGESPRAEEAGLELDAFVSASPSPYPPASPFAPAGPRPRRQAIGVAEANEEVHVSIGAITVTIEDPTAEARPAAPAPAPRPEPDFRSRMARHYLRPE